MFPCCKSASSKVIWYVYSCNTTTTYCRNNNFRIDSTSRSIICLKRYNIAHRMTRTRSSNSYQTLMPPVAPTPFTELTYTLVFLDRLSAIFISITLKRLSVDIYLLHRFLISYSNTNISQYLKEQLLLHQYQDYQSSLK